ncbi:hypothetical protein [Devosia sp.]|uniref:hypothetical protein n=1 Tax=Devosia sp. TaxID=1871048 RepID=UPI0019F54604|nr:hypothetical protein [Devosia sp.]MBE0580824.1 hypothetical protein [Devosia sp.]
MMTLRARLEAMIEDAITLLDEIDGDCDDEDDGTTEPSLDPSIATDAAGRWFWIGDDREGCANDHAA